MRKLTKKLLITTGSILGLLTIGVGTSIALSSCAKKDEKVKISRRDFPITLNFDKNTNTLHVNLKFINQTPQTINELKKLTDYQYHFGSIKSKDDFDNPIELEKNIKLDFSLLNDQGELNLDIKLSKSDIQKIKDKNYKTIGFGLKSFKNDKIEIDGNSYFTNIEFK